MKKEIMIIAVDFDGTIVEHRYPEIGKEMPFAVATLCQLQRDMPGLHIVLWTVREGRLLQDAVDWCEKRGLNFYAVNSNYPGEISSAADQGCRKVSADLYIDDRNLGGLPSWPEIYKKVSGREQGNIVGDKVDSSFISRLFSRR